MQTALSGSGYGATTCQHDLAHQAAPSGLQLPWVQKYGGGETVVVLIVTAVGAISAATTPPAAKFLDP